MVSKEKIGVIGCGWLGFPLAIRFVKKGHEVHGTTRGGEKLKELDANGIISHALPMEEMLQPQNWINDLSIVVVTIPPSGFQASYAKYMSAIIHQTNEHAKVVFISSTSVYADNNGDVDENTTANGEGRNGPAIIQAEKELQEKLKHRLTIIRMSGLVGENRHPARFMSGRTISNGDAPINLIHLEDCIGLIHWVVENGFWGKIINGVSPEHPVKKEYYQYAAEKLNVPPAQFIPEKKAYKIVRSIWEMDPEFYAYRYQSSFDYPL